MRDRQVLFALIVSYVRSWRVRYFSQLLMKWCIYKRVPGDRVHQRTVGRVRFELFIVDAVASTFFVIRRKRGSKPF